MIVYEDLARYYLCIPMGGGGGGCNSKPYWRTSKLSGSLPGFSNPQTPQHLVLASGRPVLSLYPGMMALNCHPGGRSKLKKGLGEIHKRERNKRGKEKERKGVCIHRRALFNLIWGCFEVKPAKLRGQHLKEHPQESTKVVIFTCFLVSIHMLISSRAGKSPDGRSSFVDTRMTNCICFFNQIIIHESAMECWFNSDLLLYSKCYFSPGLSVFSQHVFFLSSLQEHNVIAK